ncbi:MAG: 4Fe-4S binding protein [Desulfobacteraceae bacterium]|nr:4Fe-4S binding protein [Desulfobacteraceae bacterium]
MKRKIIEIDEERCDGCGQCVLACAEGAIQIIDGKAKVIADKYCDGLGACIGDCPQDALHIIEREADEFDEVAVEKMLEEQKHANKEVGAPACGCPSTATQTFPVAETACDCANTPIKQMVQPNTNSCLGHWPVQIKLVPVGAPFLKNADLLIAADCVPVAYPTFHADFLKDKVVMIGCPKFDDADEYVEKFAEIFKTADLKSITALVMEVPCCSAMPVIIQKAMDLSGKDIPVKKIVISSQGAILP